MKKPNPNLINLIKILNQSKEKSYEFSKKILWKNYMNIVIQS